MSKSTIRKLRNLILTGVLATGIAGALAMSEARAWSLEEAAKPYAGTDVRGICDGYSPCLAYTEMARNSRN